ncbi:hydrolase TatD [Marinihelvus fidelis]|uniref:Hydrolase TatD n=1 Tax=Marinihelvus fidelis TaxID=2613842 RepID=A0A5N0TDJ4_9GAMM|nr:TatD family hydrolase [Marinihelvus fidelis]KAA9131369.1 hydrolase TatD [Marinihelvus fidelis]
MELIDIGCNLTHDSFDADRNAVIEAARDAGVVQMVLTGASLDGSKKALALARARPGEHFATAGMHPHHASDWTTDVATRMAELATAPEVVAVGEAGLDYFRNFSPREDQLRAFEAQLALGAETGKPLFLHLRDAHEDFHAVLSEWRDRLSDVVVHCFTGSRKELHAYLALDCHIGITGWICDERRGTHMKAYLHEIPADRLMIETDAPYLKPRNLRPKIKSHRNEPKVLPWILGTLAAVRGEHPADLAATTTANARRFFRLPVAGSFG